jgi:hypothetical protein
MHLYIVVHNWIDIYWACGSRVGSIVLLPCGCYLLLVCVFSDVLYVVVLSSVYIPCSAGVHAWFVHDGFAAWLA